MSNVYYVKHADGRIITIQPGDIDNTSPLTLPGHGKTDYGEFYNENILQIMENFASDSPPNATEHSIGMLWYNTIDYRLRMYVGFDTDIDNNLDPNNPGWIMLQHMIGSIPSNPKCGDLYYNTLTNALMVYNCSISDWEQLAIIDSQTSGYVRKSGDTMTGYLTLHNLPTAPMHATPKEYVDDTVNTVVTTVVAAFGIVGQVIFVAGNTAPNGFLKANGQAVSREEYADLFAMIGTLYGAGDGSTTFNLPDLRGEFVRGWDDGRGADSGRLLGSWQGTQNLSHNHSLSATTSSSGAHNHTLTGRLFDETHPNRSSRINIIDDDHKSSSLYDDGAILSAGAHTHTITGTTSSQGGNESRPRNIALLACIKY